MSRESLFRICGGKGFHLPLPNGCIVSVQFGYGNYCANYNHPDGFDLKNPTSPDAEIAAWDARGEWVTRDVRPDAGDNVIARQSPADVLAFINAVAALPARAIRDSAA